MRDEGNKKYEAYENEVAAIKCAVPGEVPLNYGGASFCRPAIIFGELLACGEQAAGILLPAPYYDFHKVQHCFIIRVVVTIF
jgi:hypothetical protein